MSNQERMNAAFEEIMEFLRQVGWSREPCSKTLIRTHYQSSLGKNQVLIQIKQRDICILIDPVIERIAGNWREEVIELVRIMKEEVRHMEIGLDPEGDVYVRVQLPIQHLNLERFSCLLKGLCEVADNMILPLLQANAFDNLKAS